MQTKLPIHKTDIFGCVPVFINASDWQFSAKIHGEVYSVLGFRNHRQTSGKPILIFQKQRLHVAEPQTNKKTDYLSAKFDATLIVTDILEELIDRCKPVYYAARQILNEIFI